ncbi:hypothetical protein L1047_13395 [Synechococcus sp. Nb3U1]|nr:hypothetical protein [Synechococcus sp. Nb3U1]
MQGSLEKISFGTNWYAQAEHGGFYQALATGLYREHGLDVTIQMGGPGINVTHTIETTRRLVETEPDRLQRFVAASIKGWYSFLEDPRPAFRLIQQDNPNMSNAQLVYSHEKLQEYGIIKSGDALEKGIGAVTHERWPTFFDTMTVAGVYPPTLPYQNAYTLDFINKGVAAYQA